MLIDARMVEVSTNFSRELGIEWGAAWFGDSKGFALGSQSATNTLGGWKIEGTPPNQTIGLGSLGAVGGLVPDWKAVSLPTSGTPAGAVTVGLIRSYMALEARISALEATVRARRSRIRKS